VVSELVSDLFSSMSSTMKVDLPLLDYKTRFSLWQVKMRALFAWLISHQPAVLFSHNEPATSNQPAVPFSQNKPASAISHQPTEQAVHRSRKICTYII
jgi:hypothetical protein